MGAALAEAPDEVLTAGLGEVVVAGLYDGDLDGAALDAFLAADAEQALDLWFGETDVAARRAASDRLIALIDTAITEQVNAILAHPRFAALEAAWRGVRWLVSGLDVEGLSRIRLLDARWAELARDFERAPDFDKNSLFELVYSQEFDMPGGVPFSLLVGLYDVQHRPSRGHPTDDVEVLRVLAQTCAAAFAPIVLDAAPGLFGVDRLAEMDVRRTLAADLRNPAYTRLRAWKPRRRV